MDGRDCIGHSRNGADYVGCSIRDRTFKDILNKSYNKMTKYSFHTTTLKAKRELVKIYLHIM